MVSSEKIKKTDKFKKFLFSGVLAASLFFNPVNLFSKTVTNTFTNPDGVGIWVSVDYDQVSNRVREVEDIVNNPLGYLKDKLDLTILSEEGKEMRSRIMNQNRGFFNFMGYDMDSLKEFLVDKDNQTKLKISYKSSEDYSFVKGGYSGLSLKKGDIQQGNSKKSYLIGGYSEEYPIPKILKIKSGVGVFFREDSKFSGANLELLLGTDNDKGINLGLGIKGFVIPKSAIVEGEKGYFLDYITEGGISYCFLLNDKKITPYILLPGFPSKDGLQSDNLTVGAKIESGNFGIGVGYSKNKYSIEWGIKFR